VVNAMWIDDPYAYRPKGVIRKHGRFIVLTCALWLFPFAMIATAGSFYAECLIKPPLWDPFLWEWGQGLTVSYLIDGLLMLNVLAGVPYCLLLRGARLRAAMMFCSELLVFGILWVVFKRTLIGFYF
jgi:hypothetical protein